MKVNPRDRDSHKRRQTGRQTATERNRLRKRDKNTERGGERETDKRQRQAETARVR